MSGVPKGSVLGPILFVLYTSDLSHVVDSQVYCYADDTTLVAAVGDVLNDDLSKVVDWCERWDMNLNPCNSKSLLVSRLRSELPPHPLLYADGGQMQECNMKFLGVVLNNKLPMRSTYDRLLVEPGKRQAYCVRWQDSLHATVRFSVGVLELISYYLLSTVPRCGRQQLRHIFHCLTEYSTLRLALAVMLVLIWLVGGVLVLCRCFGRFCIIAAIQCTQ